MEEEDTFYDSLEEDEDFLHKVPDICQIKPQKRYEKSKDSLEKMDSIKIPEIELQARSDHNIIPKFFNNQLSKKCSKTKIPRRNYNNNTNENDENVKDVLPFYKGDIAVSAISLKKHREKKLSNRPLVKENKKKSYVEMYQEKLKRQGLVSEGSDTSRAVISSSPRSLLGSDTEEFVNCKDDSDNDSNYLRKEKSKIETFKSSSSTTIKSNTSSIRNQSQYSRHKPYKNEKLESLKKRETYGKKASAWNQIKMKEVETLKKIKSNSICNIDTESKNKSSCG